MKIIQCDNQAEAIVKASKALNDLFARYQKTPILFLSSGGSSLQLLSALDLSNFNNRVTISVLDERFTIEQKNSNFYQLMHTPFYWPVKDKQSMFIDTQPRKDELIDGLVDRYETELHHWVESHKGGIVIITQGVGANGQTAGILPYPEDKDEFEKLFLKTDKWIVGYNAGAKSDLPLRATVTIPFLTKVVDHCVAFMTGSEKKDAFKKTQAEDGENHITPARIMHEMKDVELYTDISFRI